MYKGIPHSVEKFPKCVLVGNWVIKLWSIHTVEYYAVF